MCSACLCCNCSVWWVCHCGCVDVCPTKKAIVAVQSLCSLAALAGDVSAVSCVQSSRRTTHTQTHRHTDTILQQFFERLCVCAVGVRDCLCTVVCLCVCVLSRIL